MLVFDSKKELDLFRHADVVYINTTNYHYECIKNKYDKKEEKLIWKPSTFLKFHNRKIAIFCNGKLIGYNFDLPHENTLEFPDDFDAPEVDEGIYDIEKINEYIDEILDDSNDTDMIIRGNLMVFKKHKNIYITTDHYVARG